MGQLLSNDERSTILGMSTYWREVRKRDDASPLQGELAQIIRLLGTKILWIVEQHARLEREKTEEDEEEFQNKHRD